MPAYSYALGLAFAATGTAAIAGTTAVTGTGTAFLTQFAAGYFITVNGKTRIVSAVASDTALTVTVAFATTASGQAVAGVSMKNVETLSATLLAPHSEPIQYSQDLPLGDGTVRGGGWAKTRWTWGFLSQADRDLLRAYCPGKSAAVYLRTLSADWAWTYYAGTLIWPQTEERFAGRRLQFAFEFQALRGYP